MSEEVQQQQLSHGQNSKQEGKMTQKSYDFVIVGSGTGGSVLARELSSRGKSVLVIEGGKRAEHLGMFDEIRFNYDANHITHVPKLAKEGAIIWRTLMVGGSSVVACGNGVRALGHELKELGIDLENEFIEAENYTHARPLDESLLSEGSLQIRKAGEVLGYPFQLMPKIVNAAKCHKDHACALGCRYHARWTGVDAIDEALQHGAEIMTQTRVDRVVVANGKVIGVAAKSSDGEPIINATKVIVAAGGLGTPVILQRSGISEAGSNLFLDLFVNVYGDAKGLNLVHEPQMSLVNLQFHQDEGFLLSPYINAPRQVRFIEGGLKAYSMNPNNMLGLMVKTRDDCAGRVFPDGTVSKPVTAADARRLKRGRKVAEELLVKAGANPKSIVVSRPQGAHPGGTAAIGKVVDANLQTRIDGLFVCDASVLPSAPGLPPIITIIALAKWLAERLA
jgi:choline dehydrogenase-like flavoprotein